jgi:hypothetical protein
MYHIDPTVIIRNPSYPSNKLEKIDLESIIKFDERFKEAIQIASPTQPDKQSFHHRDRNVSFIYCQFFTFSSTS